MMLDERPTFSISEPTNLVILGSAGALAQTKLRPALGRLQPPAGPVNVLPVDRRAQPSGWRAWGAEVIRWIREHSRRQSQQQQTNLLTDNQLRTGGGAATDDILKNYDWGGALGDLQLSDTYYRLADAIEKNKEASNQPTYFYAAIPPALQPVIIHNLSTGPLRKIATKSRLVLEKPLGSDLKSAKFLLDILNSYEKHYEFGKAQIVLIDHYLYKPLFEQWIMLAACAQNVEMWDGRQITSIEVTVIEKDGIGKEPATYEQLGALGDMIQSHLLKLLSATIAHVEIGEQGIDWEMHDKVGVKTLNNLNVSDKGDIIIAQYDNAEISEECETYVELILHSNDGDWKDVPFILRTGKMFAERYAEIKVNLTDGSVAIFSIQPDPEIIIESKGPQGQSLINFLEEIANTAVHLSIILEKTNTAKLKDTREAEQITSREHDMILSELINHGMPNRKISCEWAIRAWAIIETVRSYKKNGSIKMQKYRPGSPILPSQDCET